MLFDFNTKLLCAVPSPCLLRLFSKSAAGHALPRCWNSGMPMPDLARCARGRKTAIADPLQAALPTMPQPLSFSSIVSRPAFSVIIISIRLAPALTEFCIRSSRCSDNSSAWQNLVAVTVLGRCMRRYVIRHQSAVNVVVNHHNRSQAARAKTAGVAQRKATVGGGLADLYIQLLHHAVHDLLRALNIARSAQTHADDEAAARFQRELGVESGYAVNFAERYAQTLGDGYLKLSSGT